MGAARAPRRLARHAPPRRAAGGGRPRRRRRAARPARDAPARRLPAPAQRGDPRPAPRLAGRRGLARARPARAARRRLRRGAAAARGDALLRQRDRHAQRGPSRRPPRRRRARARPQRLGAQRRAARRLARRGRPARRGDAPPGAAQPPGGLRAPARLAGLSVVERALDRHQVLEVRAHGALGGRRLVATDRLQDVAVLGEDVLAAQRRADVLDQGRQQDVVDPAREGDEQVVAGRRGDRLVKARVGGAEHLVAELGGLGLRDRLAERVDHLRRRVAGRQAGQRDLEEDPRVEQLLQRDALGGEHRRRSSR